MKEKNTVLLTDCIIYNQINVLKTRKLLLPTQLTPTMTLPIFFVQLIVIISFRSAFSGAVPNDDMIPSSDLPADINDSGSLLSTFDSDPEFRHQQQHDQHLQPEEELAPTSHWDDFLGPPPSSSGNTFDELPVKRSAQNFIRLGRTRSNAFMRLGRGENGFIRFGRSGGGAPSSSNGNSIGRRDNGFLRFGRANGENLIQYGGFGDLADDRMRFGRRGDKFIRFGRSQGQAQMNGGSLGNSIDRDDGKRYADIIGGKTARAQNFIRLGRARADNNFIRLGRKAGAGDDIDSGLNAGNQWGSVTSTIAKNSQMDIDDIAPPTSADVDEPSARLANDDDFPTDKWI